MGRGAAAQRRAAAIVGVVATVMALTLVWAPGAGAVLAHVGNGRVAGIAVIRGVSPAWIPGSFAARVPRTASLSSNGNLDYHGGPVLHASAPYLVFWDPNNQISSADKTLFVRYFADVAHDSGSATNVYPVDRQFTDSSGFADYSQTWSSAAQAITDTRAYPTTGQCTENAGYVETACLYDGQIQAEVQRLITADGLPSGHTGTAPIYFVVTPPTVNSCFSDDATCADNYFCAYHGPSSADAFLYADIPLLLAANDPKGCQYDGNSAVQSPNSNPLVDVAIKYMSHEDNETITDPLLNAWFDTATGEEDGDNCDFAGTFDPASGTNPDAFLPTLGGSAGAGTLYDQLINGNGYYVQSEWSNGNVNCEMQPAAATLSPSFSAPAAASSGDAVSFDPSASSSSAGYTSVTWNFGDGSAPKFATGAPATVSHTFTSAGTHTVILTEVDRYGNLKAVSHSIDVTLGPAPAFSFSPTAPAPNASVSFDASGSTDSGGTITNYSWDFGDGSTTNASSPTASHTYATAGTYTVTLTVTDNNGHTATVSHTVQVVGAPTAAFTITTQNPVLGLPVGFDGSGSSEPGGAITNYSWSFGDGSGATGKSTSHTYSSPGSYTVTLMVTGSNGETANVSHTVTIPPTLTGPVLGQPAARITVGTAHPVAGWAVPLSAASSTDQGWDLIAWTWSFGDGTTGSGQTLSHRFRKPGTYPLTLTVADGSNASNTTTMMVRVGSASITSVSVKKGTKVERLTLQISGPGRLIVGAKRNSIKHPESFKLSVELGQAQRNRLRHHHSVKVSVKLKFVPSVGTTSSRTVRVTVKP